MTKVLLPLEVSSMTLHDSSRLPNLSLRFQWPSMRLATRPHLRTCPHLSALRVLPVESPVATTWRSTRRRLLTGLQLLALSNLDRPKILLKKLECISGQPGLVNLTFIEPECRRSLQMLRHAKPSGFPQKHHAAAGKGCSDS